MHQKKVPTHRRNTRRAIRARRPLQPAHPALPEDIPMSPRDSDSDASSVGPPATAAPKKKRTIQRITLKLTDAEEVDVIEWIKANPSIFNKAHADCKNRKERDQLFADKAAQLGEGLTEQDLYKWYLWQRTAFTKLIQRPANGSGTVQMTARQQWVVESISFLKGHCTSIPLRKGVDLTAARKKRYGNTPLQQEPVPTAPEYAPSTASAHLDADLLGERDALTPELRQLRQERTDAAAVTTRQLIHLMRQMTPSLQDQFMTETLASVVRYVNLSRERTQQVPLKQLPSLPARLHQPIL